MGGRWDLLRLHYVSLSINLSSQQFIAKKRGHQLLDNLFLILMGGRWDSNPRLPVPQTSALTN